MKSVLLALAASFCSAAAAFQASDALNGKWDTIRFAHSQGTSDSVSAGPIVVFSRPDKMTYIVSLSTWSYRKSRKISSEEASDLIKQVDDLFSAARETNQPLVSQTDLGNELVLQVDEEVRRRSFVHSLPSSHDGEPTFEAFVELVRRIRYLIDGEQGAAANP